MGNFFFKSLIQSPYLLEVCAGFLFILESVLGSWFWVVCLSLEIFQFYVGYPICCVGFQQIE